MIKEKNLTLREVLKMHRNNTNRQYTFTINKKAMIEFGLSPEMILKTPIILIKNKKEVRNKNGNNKNN